MRLPVIIWLDMYDSFDKVGPDATMRVAWLGGLIARARVEGPAAIDIAEIEQSVIQDMMWIYRSVRSLWSTKEDIVLEATYQQLRAGTIDHLRAAQFARADRQFRIQAQRSRVEEKADAAAIFRASPGEHRARRIEPAQQGEAQGRVRLRRLRAAALRLDDEI